MKTTTIGGQLLEELFPDVTTQLVQSWTRSHVEDLATEVLGTIDNWGPRTTSSVTPPVEWTG